MTEGDFNMSLRSGYDDRMQQQQQGLFNKLIIRMIHV
jgi:hypothetical protein